MIDQFDITDELIPSGVNYQWADKEFLPICLSNGWKKVPFERHQDWFGGACKQADNSIMIDGQTLIEKSTGEVTAAMLADMEAAMENERKALEKIQEATKEVNDSISPFKMKVSIRGTATK